MSPLLDFESIKQVDSLRVYKQSQFAGHLYRTQQGCELKFESDFLQKNEFDKLTFCIPKKNITYSGVNIPAFFAGLLPEGLRLKAIRQALKTSEDDMFTLLAAVGEHTIGDVYTMIDSLSVPKQDPIKIDQADFYKLFEQSYSSLSEESFSGVQEKISASMISFPTRIVDKNKSYILKLNPKDKPSLIFNEHQCLKLAERCGLSVNKSKIVYDKNKAPGLLVERFDRPLSSESKTRMIHQEDACQFLDSYPADKYRLSFNKICTRVSELATAPKIEILKLIELYLFSYFIGNGDLHAKNISLQTDHATKRVRLTPGYDLICTYLYKDHSMALMLNGRDKNFNKKHFIEFALRYGISEKAMGESVEKIKEVVVKHKDYLFEIPQLSAKDENLLKLMLKERMFD